jgi:hypothetical protein
MTDTRYEPEEIVMVPVPVRLLRAVYALIAQDTGVSLEPAVASRDVEVVEVERQGSWTEVMVRHLAVVLRHPAVRQLLTMAAQAAPKSVSFAEVVHAAATTEKKLRGEVASLSKLSRRVTPDGKISWPLSVDYRENGTAHYTMDPRIAEWWLSAVAGDGI